MQENEIVATKWLFFIVLGSFGKQHIIVIYKVKQSKIISGRKVVSVCMYLCVCKLLIIRFHPIEQMYPLKRNFSPYLGLVSKIYH